MSTIVIDGLNEEEFRRSIENRLREGQINAALERLRPLIEAYAGPDGPLPERFNTVTVDDLALVGWEDLREAVKRRDLPGRRISAIGIAYVWAGDVAPPPDADGCLQPCLEVSYYSDNAYPFSQSTRDDLLEGYSFYGCSWSGDHEATDSALRLTGIDDLHGALAALEAELLSSEEPDEDGIRAGSLGACLLNVLLVQAVTERINADGLPRPICVTAGSNGVYPYFDVPVVGMPEDAIKSAEPEEMQRGTETDRGVPVPRYSSLLMTSIPQARKRAVLVLDHDEDEMASRLARLRTLSHPDNPDAPPEAQPEPDFTNVLPIAAANGPLLAQKPARKSPDFRDMLSPRPAAAVAEVEVAFNWQEPADLAEAPPPEPDPQPAPLVNLPSEAPLGPGFTLLEADLQQRLQRLLEGNTASAAEVSWPEVNTPELITPAPEAPARRRAFLPESPPEPVGLLARIGAWFRAKLGR